MNEDKPMPKISVLLNNYNYGCFVGEAIRSVLDQDFRDFELIAVDDGSSDDSRDIIGSFEDDRIKTVFKANGGQLSAFNTGVLESRGEILCFLDSDDTYRPGYLRAVSEYYDRNPDCGCLLGRVEYFGRRTGFDKTLYDEGPLGADPFAVIADYRWTGTPTSAYSIRREFAAKFLPYCEGEKFWKVRADDLLVWGAELSGAIKYSMPEPIVRYRVHGNNSFFNVAVETTEQERRERLNAADAFFKWVMRKNGITASDLLRMENRTGTLPNRERFRNWYKIGRQRRIGPVRWLLCGLFLLVKCTRD